MMIENYINIDVLNKNLRTEFQVSGYCTQTMPNKWNAGTSLFISSHTSTSLVRRYISSIIILHI